MDYIFHLFLLKSLFLIKLVYAFVQIYFILSIISEIHLDFVAVNHGVQPSLLRGCCDLFWVQHLIHIYFQADGHQQYRIHRQIRAQF